MRVLIAYDGSRGAEQALTLAASLPWPAGSELRVAAVVEPAVMYMGAFPGGAAPAPDMDVQMAELHEEQVEKAARRLEGDGRRAAGSVLRGRTASVLVEEAARVGADLIIAGSRGHGKVASLLLGSVSAELVDQAPCPVLVARTDRVRRILLAVDGSEAASEAESLVAAWPIFENVSIHAVSVTEAMEPVTFGLAPAAYHKAAEEHAAFFAQAEENHSRMARETAERLSSAGRPAESAARTGDPADAILEVASETGADLVVLGSRGRTGLERVLLGSVARNVLHGSSASVMIVRVAAGT